MGMRHLGILMVAPSAASGKEQVHLPQGSRPPPYTSHWAQEDIEDPADARHPLVMADRETDAMCKVSASSYKDSSPSPALPLVTAATKGQAG